MLLLEIWTKNSLNFLIIILLLLCLLFPLLKPINATVAILIVLWAWNDSMLALVQYVFQSQFNTDYSLAFASYILALAPMLLVYIFAQKWIISGVMKGSVKG